LKSSKDSSLSDKTENPLEFKSKQNQGKVSKEIFAQYINFIFSFIIIFFIASHFWKLMELFIIVLFFNQTRYFNNYKLKKLKIYNNNIK